MKKRYLGEYEEVEPLDVSSHEQPAPSGTNPSKQNKKARAGGSRGWGRREERAEKEEREDSRLGFLPATETRQLALKNHFPVAMRLLSLSMEDCQVKGRVTCV